MSFKLAELFVDISGRDSHFNSVLNRVEKRVGAATIALGTMAGNVLTGALGKAVDGMSGLFERVIGGASDLTETISKVETIFGRAASTITGTADELARLYGLPRNEILDAAAGIGLVAKAAGQSEQQAANLGSQMARLAADASSFYNVPLPDALEKIRAGLVGEAEPLRAFGVLLSEDAVKAEALSMGLVKNAKDLTEGQKVQARAAIIARQLGDAQGDLARTSGGYANQVREFGGRLVNMFAELGQKLLPAATAIMKGANTLLQDLGNSVASHMPMVEAFANRLAKLGPVIGAAWSQLPTTLKLVGSVIRDTLSNALEVAKNLLVGLAKFAGDLFGQIGKTLSVHLENAVKDAAESMGDLIFKMTLGQVNVSDMEGMNYRRQAQPIRPDLSLIGNPFEGTGWSDRTKDLCGKLSGAGGATAGPVFGKADPSGKLAAQARREQARREGAGEPAQPLAARSLLDGLKEGAGGVLKAVEQSVLDRMAGGKGQLADGDKRLAEKDAEAGRRREGRTTDIVGFAAALQAGAWSKDNLPKEQLKTQQESHKTLQNLLSEVKRANTKGPAAAVAV